MIERIFHINIEGIDHPVLIRAGENEVDQVWGIIQDNSNQLLSNLGLDHWSNYYTRQVIEEKINKQDVFLLSSSDTPVATIVLSSDPVDYYTQKDLSCFAKPAEKALYISSLAVSPHFQKRGIAGKLMEFATKVAQDQGIKFIRFDCRAEYTDLVSFYEKRGYVRKGSFTEGEGQNYFLMEKELN